jgi:anti-sigma factor RsiW
MTKTPCQEFADRIVDYVDGELPQDQAQAMAQHLAECERCRQTADALRRSLGLARVLWEDNLGDMTAVRSDAVGATPRGCPPRTGRHGSLPLQRTAGLPRQKSFYVLAAAAGILLATGSSLLVFFHHAPRQSALTLEEVQARVDRAGTAAELLAATRIVAQCEGMESIVEQQYHYILREYADTPAAASIKADQNPKLGGMKND